MFMSKAIQIWSDSQKSCLSIYVPYMQFHFCTQNVSVKRIQEVVAKQSMFAQVCEFYWEWSRIHATASSLICLNGDALVWLKRPPGFRIPCLFMSFCSLSPETIINKTSLCRCLLLFKGSLVLIAFYAMCWIINVHDIMLYCIINPAFLCLHNHEHCCSGWNSTFHC